jgi:hypothetical protein
MKKNSRKNVTGRDWLNDIFVEKNKDYFLSGFLLKEREIPEVLQNPEMN